jgi:hypothetical protein
LRYEQFYDEVNGGDLKYIEYLEIMTMYDDEIRRRWNEKA